MKLNLIYNADIRNNGTAVHFWDAFTTIGCDFKRYRPDGVLPPADFSIYIDDGRDDLKWLPKRPWGYYAIDTHLGWDYRRWKAGHADIVWCAQQPAAERMRAEGLNAHWLPLGCNPTAHPTAHELRARLNIPVPDKNIDLAFVGFMQDPAFSSRVSFLDQIFKVFPNFFFAYGVFHEDMARIYHKAKIGINHAVRDDLNMRFFELASIGVAQLCDRRMVGIDDLGFIEGQHFIGYSSAEEAIGQIAKYIERPLDLIQMAERARQLVRSGHTYVKRAKQMLASIETLMGVSA